MLSKSVMGKRARGKGLDFERKIATALRAIYDSPELTAELAASTRDRARHRELLKSSKVRRSDQGKGALEPDVVVQDCPVWHELQRAKRPEPVVKLAQAERDVAMSGSDLWPVSICALAGSTKTTVCMRAITFLALADLELPKGMRAFGEITVQIDLEPYLQLLRDDYDRRS